MSEPTHKAGPILSVPCDDDGNLFCASCQDDLPQDQVYMLLRWPTQNTWFGLCLPCTREVAAILLTRLSIDDYGHITLEF